MHEFKLINGGKSALFIIQRPEFIELDTGLLSGQEVGWIETMGFQEVGTETGDILFQWWAYPEVRPRESKVRISGLQGPPPTAWNWL